MSSQETRRPETIRQLKSLKGFLSVAPKACSQESAVEILAKAAKATNPNWTVPSLGHPDGVNKIFPDGTVRVMLLAHMVFINLNGAYRIIDCQPPSHVFHESPSSTGAIFVEPSSEGGGPDNNELLM